MKYHDDGSICIFLGQIGVEGLMARFYVCVSSLFGTDWLSLSVSPSLPLLLHCLYPPYFQHKHTHTPHNTLIVHTYSERSSFYILTCNVGFSFWFVRDSSISHGWYHAHKTHVQAKTMTIPKNVNVTLVLGSVVEERRVSTHV